MLPSMWPCTGTRRLEPHRPSGAAATWGSSSGAWAASALATVLWLHKQSTAAEGRAIRAPALGRMAKVPGTSLLSEAGISEKAKWKKQHFIPSCISSICNHSTEERQKGGTQ